MELSKPAQEKRLKDMQATVDETDPAGRFIILLIGLWLLALLYMAKLTPGQRTALYSIAILSGGAVIGLLVYYQQVWLALVLVFVLGVAIGMIHRM